MLQCSRSLREITNRSTSLDEAATAIVGYLYSQFADPVSKEPQCALVRFYKTNALQLLDDRRQDFARRKFLVGTLEEDTRILTLVATTGLKPEWCDPLLSQDHQAIPLLSVEMVEQAPMIAGLIKAIGLDIADVLGPSISLLNDAQGKTYNVFHVERAPGSPLIPVQRDFVEPYGIASVIGFGGVLPNGDFFALVMFSKVTVPAASAARFRSVALDVKASLHPFASPTHDDWTH